jgi:hypothetical protein
MAYRKKTAIGIPGARFIAFGVSVVAIAFLMLAQSALAQAIINFNDLNVELPGVSKGKVTGYWLAPYVRVSTENIGKRNVTIVMWLGENGEVKRRAEVDGFLSGFVTTSNRRIPAWLAENRWTGRYFGPYEFHTIVQGVNEDCRLTVPQRTGLSESLATTADSRVLVVQYFQPTNATIALSIYVHGNLVTNIGPYAQYGGEPVHLGDDGSAALLTSIHGNYTSAQAVVLGSDGQVRFRVDIPYGVSGAVPGPDGSGVLLRSNRSEGPDTYLWYTKDEKAESLYCGANACCAGWIPGSHRCVFDTSIDDYHRYRLIDWDTTKALWEVPCPTNGRVLAIGCSTNYVLLAVAESYTTDRAAWFRCFYAVNVSDGRTVARWVAPYPRQVSLNQNQSFVRLHGKLYYLTPDEFAEIREDEIAAKTNHWYPVTP